MFKKLFYSLFSMKKQKPKQKEEVKRTTLEAERLERNRILHSTRVKQSHERLLKASPTVHPVDPVLVGAALLVASSSSQAEPVRERERESYTPEPAVAASFDSSSFFQDTSSSSCDTSSCCDSSSSF